VPSTHQSAASGDRERFPEVAEVIGEDPARWLDRDLFDHGVTRHRWIEGDPYPEYAPRPDEDVSAPGQMIRDRIQGIDDLSVIARWLEVEHALGRGPRDRVVELLEARAAELKEIGERPERLQYGPREPCDCCGDDGPTAADLREKREREREKRVGGYETTSAVEQQSNDETEASTLGAFATDGGTDA